MFLLTLPDFNSSPHGQDSRRFADDTFRCILWMKRRVFWFKFPCSLFLKVRFTISQHWFWKGLVSKEATGLPGQHWPISMTHICATRGIRSEPSPAQPSPARASRAEPSRAYQPWIRAGGQAWDTAVRRLGCPMSDRCFNRWDFSQSRLGIDAREQNIEFWELSVRK